MIYEGIVTSLKENGKAEVVIHPRNAGVPGVSKEINARVCHCATPASTITIEALNPAGAGVGDMVSVTRDTSDLLKNWGILLGIPFTGLIVGIVLAFLLTNGFSSFHPAVGIAAGITITLLAVALSAGLYKRVSTDRPAIIDHIIQVGGKPGEDMCGGIFPSVKESSACGACSGTS